MVSIVRILVIGFLFGNAFSIAFSLAGGMLSLLCMELARRFGKFGCAGVSMVGGVMHNAGQIVIAILIVENVKIGYYFPVLMITGLITGILIGIVSNILIRRMRKILPELERNNH